jgi:hypothetical protein
VEDGHGDDRRDVKPDGDVEVALPAAGQGSEEVDREDDPDRRDQMGDGPVNISFKKDPCLKGLFYLTNLYKYWYILILILVKIFSEFPLILFIKSGVTH